MKILIKENAANTSYWYHDKVGEVLEAKEIDFDGDYTIDDGRYVRYGHAEEVIEHNSQLYRKVDRPVREGDTVLIVAAYTTFGKYKNGDVLRCAGVPKNGRYMYSKQAIAFHGNDTGVIDAHEFVVLEAIEQPVQPSAPSYAEVSELLHEASRQTRIDNAFEKVVERNGAALKRLSEPDFGPEPAKDKFDGLPTVPELIANLAQEVAELKRQLTNAQTDIADLEDRLDENEKDVEEVIGRINDLGDGAKAADLSGVLTELTRLEVQARECSEDYGKEGAESSEQYFDGVADGYKLSIIKLKEALRNG